MIRFDARRATRLRGSFYLQLGAVPLAVETFRPLGGDPEVAGILLSLQQKGLHRFQRSERLGWTVFEADAGSLPARTIAYWYPNRGGRLAAHLGVELAMRPAPRPFTLPLVLQSLLRLRWPWVQQPREYELVLWGDGAQQVVALWDWEPREDEITDAARRARVAFQPLREAEALLQAGRRDEALAIALAQSAAPRWWFTPRPHLTALSLGVRAAAEQGDRALAERLALRIGDWHPMWGALVLARAWEAAGWADRARAAYDQALAVAPQRGEPLLQRARFEWAVALADRSSERPAAWLRAQKAARRLQELRPAEGLWLRARIAFELDGHALAGVLLRQLALTPGAPDGAFEMQALLESLAQWDFARAGEPVALGNGLALHGWRSRERPPEDPALKHHGAELLVVDADGDLVETFTLTSQRAVAQGARQYTVDRVTAHGTRQLRAYGNRPPSFERLAAGAFGDAGGAGRAAGAHRGRGRASAGAAARPGSRARAGAAGACRCGRARARDRSRAGARGLAAARAAAGRQQLAAGTAGASTRRGRAPAAAGADPVAGNAHAAAAGAPLPRPARQPAPQRTGAGAGGQPAQTGHVLARARQSHGPALRLMRAHSAGPAVGFSTNDVSVNRCNGCAPG